MRISEQKYRKMSVQKKYLFPPGLEPGTFRVLGERDNHYTTETWGRRTFVDEALGLDFSGSLIWIIERWDRMYMMFQ